MKNLADMCPLPNYAFLYVSSQKWLNTNRTIVTGLLINVYFLNIYVEIYSPIGPTIINSNERQLKNLRQVGAFPGFYCPPIQ